MKKIFLFLIALILLIVCMAAAGCSGSENPPEDENTLPETFDPTLYIKNKDLWNGRRLTDDGLYNFIVEYKSEKIEEGGFGVSYNKFGGDFIHDTKSTPGEWANALISLYGVPDGAGNISTYDFFADGGPISREQALERVLEFLGTYKEQENQFPFYSEILSYYPWHHYAGMAGYDNLGVEIGENLQNYQFELATIRGAAKQYDATWFVDFSAWYKGTLTSYAVEEVKNEEGDVIYSPKAGHSLSLTERSLMTSFMLGADATIVEGGEHRLYYPGTEDVTPLGELCRRLYAFTSEHNDMGTAYAPFALMLDVYHGTFERFNNKIFAVFPQEDYDRFTGNLIVDFLWQDYLETWYAEDNKLINNEFGDTFDCLLYGASEELLNTYKALIFTGNPDPSDEELAVYQRYVENGGVIVLNTVYAPVFASFIELPEELDEEYYGKYYQEIPYGKGSFIVFGEGGGRDYEIMNFEDPCLISCGDYETGGFDYVMRELYKRYVPFEFSERVQHIISIDDDCIYLYLCNNLGVKKAPVGEVRIDESKTMDLTGTFTAGYGIDKIEDIYNGNDITLDGTSFSLTLSPGEIAVLKIDIGGRLQ